nr:hypothetical protein [uncultured Anaerosporobacter sp.]
MKLGTSEIMKCRKQALIFEISVERGWDSYSFMRKWMLSEVRAQLDNEEPALISQSRYYLLEVFEEDNVIESGETYDIDIMHWLGFLYSYWHYEHEVTSKEILEMITPEDILINYDVLHTQSNKHTLDWIYEHANKY